MFSYIHNASKVLKVSVLVLCLSGVLNIEAFSSTSRAFSFLKPSTSALYQQVAEDDDDPKPFFFTGEMRDEAENLELRRVFLGAESLRTSSDMVGEPVNPVGEEGESRVDLERERQNLERMFRL